jgi:hypothetical protein
MKLVTLGLLLSITALQPAAADNQTALQIARFFSVGGYFFTDASARQAVGTPKFYGETTLYTRPKHLGHLSLTGGLQLIGASDHFLPLSGGNEASWIGPSVRVSPADAKLTLRPYLTGGLFAGHVRSERLGIDRWDVAPSAAVGVETALGRYLILDAGYRVSKRISGVSLDGFVVNLRVR